MNKRSKHCAFPLAITRQRRTAIFLFLICESSIALTLAGLVFGLDFAQINDKSIVILKNLLTAVVIGIVLVVGWLDDSLLKNYRVRVLIISMACIHAFFDGWGLVVPARFIWDWFFVSLLVRAIGYLLLFVATRRVLNIGYNCLRRYKVEASTNPRNRCLGCGYCLIGLTDARCPECGQSYSL